MKEIEDNKPRQVQESKRHQEKKQRLLGSITLHPGQHLYRFDMSTQKFEKVDMHRNVMLQNGKAVPVATKIVCGEHEIYVTAINEKNAKRKILKKFGIKWDEKKRRPVMPGRMDAKIIQLSKPSDIMKDSDPRTQVQQNDNDPDAETDQQEPFEDEGAPDDDFTDE